jgi:hypothetical protein
MAPPRDSRVALIALAMLLVGLLVGIAVPVVWFRIASSGAVRDVRALEDRAIGVIEDLRIPGLELRHGPTRKEDGEIRKAWAFSMLGSPDWLSFFLSDPYWKPGRGVLVTAMFRSDLDMRQTCLRLARHIGEPPARCPDEDWEEYWLPIEAEGADGSVTIYLRRLRDAEGALEREFSVVADFSVQACGTLREPGSGPCP